MWNLTMTSTLYFPKIVQASKDLTNLELKHKDPLENQLWPDLKF